MSAQSDAMLFMTASKSLEAFGRVIFGCKHGHNFDSVEHVALKRWASDHLLEAAFSYSPED